MKSGALFCGVLFVTVVAVASELVWLHDTTSDHAKRHLQGGLPSNLRFNMTYNKKQFELNIEENKRLNPNAPIFEVRTNLETGLNELTKITKTPPFKKTKFYQDKANGGAFSVTCENKQSGPCTRLMTGSMHLDGRTYEIRPAPSMLTVRGLGQTSHGVAHELTERRDMPALSVENKDYQEYKNEDKQEKDYKLNRLKEELKALLGVNKQQKIAEKMKVRARRSTGPYALEVLVVADTEVWNRFSSRTANSALTEEEMTNDLRQHYVHIINGISLRYEEIDDPQMDIYVTLSGFLIYKQDDSTNPLTPSSIDEADGKNATAYLYHIQTWATHLNELDLPHNDHIMVFTGYELYSNGSNSVAGIAFLSGVCRPNRVSVQEDKGASFFTTVSVAAHELGHNLDSWHDGEKTSGSCSPANANIMASSVANFNPNVAYSVNPWRFSTCSVNAFKTYVNLLDSLQTNCLLDHGDYYDDDEYQTHTELLPGQLHTPDEQCKLVRGDNSGLCSQNAEAEDFCRLMLCHGDGDGYCWYYAAAMGTPCGQPADNKWCFEGQCVARSDIFSGNTGGGASVGSGNTVSSVTGSSGTGSNNNAGNEATTTPTEAATTPPSSGTCTDDGWSGWTCPELSEYFFASYGAIPAQWCQDPTWTPRCCQTCAAASGQTTTTAAPATGSCVDIGWSGYSCEAVEEMFLDQQGITPSYWCRDPSWKAICCSLCEANGI